MSERVRAWTYRALVVIILGLAAAGYISEDLATEVVTLIGSLLGVAGAGLASRFTSTRKETRTDG